MRGDSCQGPGYVTRLSLNASYLLVPEELFLSSRKTELLSWHFPSSPSRIRASVADVVTFARPAVTVMTSDTRSPSCLDWLTKAQMTLT